jgi:hypothetical protein
VEPGAALQGTQRPPSSPGGGRGGRGRPQIGRSLLGASCLRPRRDRAAWRRSARLPPCRRPRRPRRQLPPRTRPGAGAPWTRGNRRRPVPRRAAASPDRTGRRATGNGPGQGRGTWSLPEMAIVYTTGSILPTQLPASVASCQRSFRVGGANPRPSLRTALWRTASWRTAAWQPLRGVLHNTPEVERGRAAPALRASDLPHWPYTAESARPPITVIGKMRRGPLQREAGTREGALRGPPGIRARIGGWPEPSSPIEQGPGELPLVSDVRQVHCLLQRPLPGCTASAGTREEGPPGSRYWAISRRAGPRWAPTGRLLQGDDLPRRCRFFVDFTTGDFLTWPNNSS